MIEAYLRAKFHLDPSNRLVTVHQRHKQTGVDRQYRRDRQRPGSIGRTVLQTVAQNKLKTRNRASTSTRWHFAFGATLLAATPVHRLQIRPTEHN